MRKIFWTTIFWALILVIAGFYLKFMDQDLGQQASNRIMSTETTTPTTDGLSGDVTQDPTQTILSGMATIQQQLTEGLSGINTKLDETKALLEDGLKSKTPTPVTKKVGTGTTTGTGTN